MKTMLCALFLAMFALATVAQDKPVTKTVKVYASAVTPGEGAPMPTCYPGKNCGD